MVGAPEASARNLRTPVLTEELGKEVVDFGRVTSTDQHEAKFQTSTGTLPSLNQTGESFLLKFEVGLDWLKQDGLSNP